MRIPLLAAGLVACCPLTTLAAEVLDLEPLVVRSTRPRFPLQPQHVTLVQADEIQRSGALNLAQLLKQQPGMAVREYGAVGSLATLTMRGALGEGVLVMRDGVKLNSPERGGVDLSTISLLGVKRVEILHGAASGLYGSEAVGGVIHLISDDVPANRLETGLGTWGFRTLRTEVGARLGEMRYALGVRRNQAANDYPYVYRGETLTRENDALDGTEVWLGIDRRLESGDLRVNLAFNHQDKRIPGPVNFPSPQAAQLNTDAQGSARWSQFWLPTLEQTVSLSHHHAEMRFTDPLSAFSKHSQSVLDATDLQTQLLWLGEAHEARVGAGLRLDRLFGSDVGSRERMLASAFVHDTWFLTPELTGFGNARLDHHPGFGLEASPRLGLTYQVLDPLRLRASVGRAYRAPTFNDLYWPKLGNPDLRPERTEVYELGVDAAQGPWSLSSTAFFNRGIDTILWKPGAGGDWMPSNVGQTETRGIETKASYQVTESLGLAGGATWLSAIDAGKTGASAGKFLLYRPAVVADLALTYRPIEPLSMGIGWSLMGERFTTAQNTERLPAHDLYSASLAYALNDRNTVTLRGENLANRYYVLQPYYPMPGRTFTASWAIRF